MVVGRGLGTREGQWQKGEAWTAVAGRVGGAGPQFSMGSPAPDVARPTLATGIRGRSLGPFT